MSGNSTLHTSLKLVLRLGMLLPRPALSTSENIGTGPEHHFTLISTSYCLILNSFFVLCMIPFVYVTSLSFKAVCNSTYCRILFRSTDMVIYLLS